LIHEVGNDVELVSTRADQCDLNHAGQETGKELKAKIKSLMAMRREIDEDIESLENVLRIMGNL
jgi:hypothetical protein